MLSNLVSVARPAQLLKDGAVLAAIVFAGELNDRTKLITYYVF